MTASAAGHALSYTASEMNDSSNTARTWDDFDLIKKRTSIPKDMSIRRSPFRYGKHGISL